MKLAFHNGTIWTGDRFASSVTIEGDRIASIDDIPPGATRFDLRGRLAIPGFIDNHLHFIGGGLQLARVRLREATSPDDFVRRIASHPRSGEWILGGEWDEQRWSPAVLPTRALLDGIEVPVWVTRTDLHMGVANSIALQRAGITRDTPDPVGGTIVRDAGGEPTGLLKDAAMTLMARVIPPPSVDERVRACRAALREAARFGVTSFCDMSWTDAFDDLAAYQQIEDELTARVYAFAPLAQYERVQPFRRSRLRTGGMKAFSDGSLGSGTAAMYEPFDDDPGNRGLLMKELADGSIARWAADADARGLQLAIHAIGDRANGEVLKIYESLPARSGRRIRIEHAQHLNRELIGRFAQSGVIAAAQPYHCVDDGHWAEKRIGSERARYAFAFRSLLDAGAILTFGSDWSVAPLDPIAGVAAAVTRNGWIPEECITVEEALRAYTVTNAWAMHAEAEVGRLAPGMRADLVVLSDDLFAIPPDQIAGVQVELTLFDGTVIHER